MKRVKFAKRIFILLLSVFIFLPNMAFASNERGIIKVKDEWDFYRKMYYSLEKGENALIVYFDDGADDILENSLDLTQYFMDISGYGLLGPYSISINLQSRYILFDFSMDYFETKEQREFVDKEINKILTQIISPSMNVREKVKAIHDWIVSNVSYDTTLSRHTSYEALTGSKTAVCQGYAMLTYKMLNKAGIPCLMISSSEMDHAWNVVNIDGQWYHLDTTFDDPIGGRGIDYYFFLLTNEKMKETHIFNEKSLEDAIRLFESKGKNLTEKIFFAKEFEVNKQNIKLEKGKIESIKLINVMPKDADISNIIWESMNPYIATVDNNGLIKAQNAGETYVKVYNKYNPNYYKIIKVNVVAADIYTKPSIADLKTVKTTVNVNKTSVTLSKGKSTYVKVTTKPTNVSIKDLVWESANKKIAIVDKSGKVTGIGKGKTTIKVSLRQNPKIYKIINVVVN